MKHGRWSTLGLFLLFIVLSLPMLTQTRVISGFSAVGGAVTENVTAFIRTAEKPGLWGRGVDHALENRGWMLFGSVLAALGVLGALLCAGQQKRLSTCRRQMELEREHRQKVEGELEKHAEDLAWIGRHSPVTAYLFQFTDQWQIAHVSDSVSDLTGYEPSYFVGRPVTAYAELIHPEDQERVSQSFDTAFQDASSLTIEYRIVTRDGGEKWVREKAVPLGGSSSASAAAPVPERIGGFLADVTAEKHAKMSMAEQQGMLHSLIEVLPDPVFFKDRKGEYLACNAAFAKIAGKEPADVVGKTDYHLFEKDTADAYRENDLNMLSRMKQRKKPERIVYPDGRRKMVETLRTPLVTMDGRVLGLLGISRDPATATGKNDDALGQAP